MDSTTLNLLARDGMATVLIAAALDADRFSELYEIACTSAESTDELRAEVGTACARWDRTVDFG